MAKSTDSKVSKKSSKSSKSSKSEVSAPVVETTPVVAAEVPEKSETEVVETEVVPVHDRIKALTENMKQLMDAVRGITTETRRELASISAQVTRESKEHARALAKASGKKRKPLSEEDRARRANAGFKKPCLISEALCDFLGVPAGTELARTDVTSKISEYVNKHKLSIPGNGRIFIPDKKLGALLGENRFDLPSGEKGYGYFNLQKYMKPHFVKST